VFLTLAVTFQCLVHGTLDMSWRRQASRQLWGFLIALTCTVGNPAGGEKSRGAVVAIIGGNRGIGFDATYHMALYACVQPDHLTIVFTCRSESDCVDAALSIKDGMAASCGTSERVQIATFAPLDVVNRSGIVEFGAFMTSAYGGVDAIVYNAGVSSSDVAYTIRVHCVGFWMAAEVLRPIMRRPGGRLVAVTSFLGTISSLPKCINPDQLEAAYSMVTDGSGPSPESLKRFHGASVYSRLNDEQSSYRYSKSLQNFAVRRIAEAYADTELEVNAVCPGNCRTPINPTGKDTTRLCTETIMWLALGRRGSSQGRRVHGGFFRYMKQISFENGRHLMDVVPDDSMRSWWDKIESDSEH
jgi:NAD(P)-dependent dehydrogenase (short-subunit alcohol dehydrogenase family)